jgi:integrase
VPSTGISSSGKGELIRKSTGLSNQRAAEKIEAVKRTALGMGAVGIKEKPRSPTLVKFAPRFAAAIETLCGEKPATLDFYQRMTLDEAAINAYKQRRSRQQSRFKRRLSVASINRELATLRRLTRLAHEWKVLDRVPRIRLLRGERNREFVLNHVLEPKYLEAAPQPLKDIAVLMLEAGLRPGEAVNLRWQHVSLQPAADAGFGYIAVRDGKSKNAKRNLSLTGSRCGDADGSKSRGKIRLGIPW